MTHLPRVFRLLPVVLVLLIGTPLWAAPPTVTRLSPRGAERGKATEIVIAGTNLTPQTQMMLPFKATQSVSAEAKPNPAQVRLQLTVDASVPPGIYPVRVATEDGVAGVFFFCIDHFAAVSEAEDNSTFDKAQKLTPPVIVNGECLGGDIDFFRFPAKKGQRLVIETEAARLGSGIVPQLRLTDEKNRFLAADDSQALRGDCRIVFTAPADGDYIVEVSDTRYRGAAPPFYRLKIADSDVVEEVFPLGGRRGEKVTFTLRGGSLAKELQLQATLDDALTTGSMFMSLDGVARPGLMPALVAVGELPERIWIKTDNQDPKGLDVLPPLTINSRLERKGDTDRFQFPVEAGQRYRLAVQAGMYGSSLDGVLRVTDQAGKQLALVDDVDVPTTVPGQPGTKSADPIVDLTVPAGVTLLRIELSDQRKRGGVNFVYRLTIEPVTADYELRQLVAELNVPRGGAALLVVPVVRRGFTGPIQVSIANLPAGLTVQGGDVPTGGTAGVLTVSAPADAPAMAPVLLRIEGKGMNEGKELRRFAAQRLVLGKEVNPSTSIVTLPSFALALTAAEPFTVQGPATFDVVRGYPTPVPVTLVRSMPAATLAIEVSGLLPQLQVPGQPLNPALFTLTPASAAAKVGNLELKMTPGPQAPLGKLTLVVQGKTKLANVDKIVTAPGVSLNVLAPFTVNLDTPALALTPGQVVSLKGKIVRQAVCKEAVTLRLDGLPAGVTLATPIAPIAAGATDFQIDLKVDPKFAVATANLSLGATATIGGVAHPQPPIAVAAKLK